MVVEGLAVSYNHAVHTHGSHLCLRLPLPTKGTACPFQSTCCSYHRLSLSGEGGPHGARQTEGFPNCWSPSGLSAVMNPITYPACVWAPTFAQAESEWQHNRNLSTGIGSKVTTKSENCLARLITLFASKRW